MQRLADVEQQLIMQLLLAKELLQLARCDKQLLHAADGAFAWKAPHLSRTVLSFSFARPVRSRFLTFVRQVKEIVCAAMSFRQFGVTVVLPSPLHHSLLTLVGGTDLAPPERCTNQDLAVHDLVDLFAAHPRWRWSELVSSTATCPRGSGAASWLTQPCARSKFLP
jgi:hypothetical protein